jgi:hypothetical protein
MFIRWQSRRRDIYPGFWAKGQMFDIHWQAILIESVRIGGQPRQRHIAYLVGFTEGQAAHPTQQMDLWDAVTKKLDKLGNRVLPKDRKRIEAAIAAKIGPPPTLKRRTELNRDRRRVLGDEWCDEQYGKDFGR